MNFSRIQSCDYVHLFLEAEDKKPGVQMIIEYTHLIEGQDNYIFGREVPVCIMRKNPIQFNPLKRF